MSTNYYFKIRPKVMVFGECSSKLRSGLIKRAKLELHIGKRSMGWKPIFYKSDYYSSVQEIKDFYSENFNITMIENEYGDEISIEQLEDELFNWESEHNYRTHLQYDNIYLDDEGYEFSEVEFS